MTHFLCAAEDVIPLRFQKSSGILSHTFRIASYRFFGSIEQLITYPILILENGDWLKYLAPMTLFPSEIEALSILSNISGESERQGRYINIHSAYEAVVCPRNLELSAIRHALAHPITALTRPNVHKALRRQFASLHIDLSNYQHQKVVYRSISEMLIAIDIAIYQKFSSRIEELIPATQEFAD